VQWVATNCAAPPTASAVNMPLRIVNCCCSGFPVSGAIKCLNPLTFSITLCCGLARQHKSQFQELIEAARKNRAAVKKPAVQSAADVKDKEIKLDDVRDDQSSTSSSVELIADGEVADDKQLTVNEPLTGYVQLTLSVFVVTCDCDCCNSKQLNTVTRTSS